MNVEIDNNGQQFYSNLASNMAGHTLYFREPKQADNEENQDL
jgi:hypothetical protein